MPLESTTLSLKDLKSLSKVGGRGIYQESIGNHMTEIKDWDKKKRETLEEQAQRIKNEANYELK